MKMTINHRQIMVTPAEPTWNGSLPLSELDNIGSTTHSGQINFYRQPPKSWLQKPETIANTLVDSLSRVLVHFYPIAGRLRSIGQGRFELVCNGKGAVFFVAELDAELADFGDFTPTPDFDEYLFPSIDYTVQIHELPLLFVQLTKFRCGGIGLSVVMSHVIADGHASAHFMSEWARLARGEPLKMAPFHDRKVATFRAGEPPLAATPRLGFDHSKDFCCLPYLLKPPGSEELKKMKTTMITLELSRQQVEKLKKMANHDNTSSTTRAYTRYEAVAAHIWRCASKARKHVEEQPTAFLVVLDSRSRLSQPPLPLGYFGNAIFDVAVNCSAGELISKPISYGASKIRQAIERVTNDYVLSTVDYLKSQQDLTKFQYSYSTSKNGGGNLLGNPNIGLINWVHLPFGGMDFGWGKEFHFGPGNHEIDGDTWMLQGRSGEGSLDILLCLLEDHVESFKNHFYQDIDQF